MNEKYFILDEIPRILGSYIEEGFSVWIAVREDEDVNIWYDPEVVPDWMREHILVIENMDFSNLKEKADQTESFVLTNDVNNVSIQGVCGEVVSIEEEVHFGTFPIVNIADVLFCFGFTESNFMNFCQQSNLIGVIGEHLIRDKDEENNTNGMAFLVDKELSWLNNFEKAVEYVNLCIKQKRFIPRNNRRMLGIIYQGKDLDMAKESELNLLYV